MHVFVICANNLLIFWINLIHSQRVITVFELFVNIWYLLKIATVVFVPTYVTVVMVAARTSAVKS